MKEDGDASLSGTTSSSSSSSSPSASGGIVNSVEYGGHDAECIDVTKPTLQAVMMTPAAAGTTGPVHPLLGWVMNALRQRVNDRTAPHAGSASILPGTGTAGTGGAEIHVDRMYASGSPAVLMRMSDGLSPYGAVPPWLTGRADESVVPAHDIQLVTEPAHDESSDVHARQQRSHGPVAHSTPLTDRGDDAWPEVADMPTTSGPALLTVGVSHDVEAPWPVLAGARTGAGTAGEPRSAVPQLNSTAGLGAQGQVC